MQPDLAKLTAELDKTSAELRKEMTAEVTKLVAAAFRK
jgi:hypothetical protein